MTEPTDTELDAVLCKHWPAFSMQATLVRMWVRAAMRDAIAKWDTPKAAPGEREQAAQRLRELAGIPQNDVTDPFHPRYIEGYKAGHAAGRKRAAPGVGNSGFDHKTAADFLNGKTVSDEAVRKFVAASRWAHDERASLSATLLAMHGVLTSREAEIALLKKALLEAEAAPKQEAPKAASGELHDHQILAITTAYEQGVGKGRQAHESGKEIANPYDTGYRCDLAWQYGYKEGKKQAERIAKAAPQQEAQEPVATLHCNDIGYVWARATEVGRRMRFEQPINLYIAPQPAPAPLSEMPYEKRKAIQEGEQIGASDAWFKARHEMLDTIDRRNVFRAGFDRGWNAALAAQGGKA